MALLRDLTKNLEAFFNATVQGVKDIPANLNLLRNDPKQFGYGAALGANEVAKPLNRALTPIAQNRFNPFYQTQAVLSMNPKQAQQFRTEVDRFVPRANLPHFQFSNPVGNFAANLPIDIAQSYLNVLPNAVAGAAKLPAARNFQQGASDIANIAEAPLTVATSGGLGLFKKVGSEGAKQVGKQGLKQVLKQGLVSGAKYGGGYGALQGLKSGENLDNPLEYTTNLVGNTVTGAAFGGILGGGTAALGYGFGKVRAALSKKAPNQDPAYVDKFIRDEVGRFAKKQKPPQNEPVWVGDMRESLGLPRHGNYSEAELVQKLKNEEGFIRIGPGKKPIVSSRSQTKFPASKAGKDQQALEKSLFSKVGNEVLPPSSLPGKAPENVPVKNQLLKRALNQGENQKKSGPPLGRMVGTSNVSGNYRSKAGVEGERLLKQSLPESSGPSQSFEEIVRSSDIDVKSKANYLDFLRTPDRVLKKFGLGKEAEQIRSSYDAYLKELPEQINKITEWSKQVSPESNQRIFKFLDGQPIQLDSNEVRVAGEIRNYLTNWADRLGLPKEKRITNYITHIFDKDFIKKEFDPEIARLIENRVPGSVYDPFVEQRLGKLGYKEDTWQALDAYVKRATRKVNMDPILEQVAKRADGLEQTQYKYVKNYLDRVNMRPTDLDNLLDNLIKSSPVGYRFGIRPVAALSTGARKAVYRATLGLNPGSALKNLTQGANTYAKLGEKYTLLGYTNLVKSLATGSKELEDVGVLKNDFIQDRTLSATKKFWEKVDKGLFVFFEGAERINRGAAYFGAKAKALSEGLDEAQAIEYAKKIVRDTQFTFGSVDTPVVLQSDIAKTLGQFQSFSLKQGEFLGELIKNKDALGLLRWGGASLLMVGSIGKLIGMEYKDIFPSFRLGVPPTLQAPYEVGKAILDSKDAYGNDRDLGEKLTDIGKGILLYAPASVQARKTISGLTSANQGYATTSGGNVKFPVEQTPLNYIRGGLFGVNNLPEAQQYYDQKQSPLGEEQSNFFKMLPQSERQGYYTQTLSNREQNKEIDKVKDTLTKGDQPKGTEQASFEFDGQTHNGYKVGDKFIYQDEDSGEIKTTTVKKIEAKQLANEKELLDAQYSLAADQLKRADNTEGWLQATTSYIDYLKEYKTKVTDQADQIKIQNKIEDLQAQVDKYKGYGGFTKPKKPKKVSVRSNFKFKKAAPFKLGQAKSKPFKLAKAPAIRIVQPKRLTIRA